MGKFNSKLILCSNLDMATRRFSGCSSVLGGLILLWENIVMNTIIGVNINVILLTG